MAREVGRRARARVHPELGHLLRSFSNPQVAARQRVAPSTSTHGQSHLIPPLRPRFATPSKARHENEREASPRAVMVDHVVGVAAAETPAAAAAAPYQRALLLTLPLTCSGSSRSRRRLRSRGRLCLLPRR
jgi:hypothetical protein